MVAKSKNRHKRDIVKVEAKQSPIVNRWVLNFFVLLVFLIAIIVVTKQMSDKQIYINLKDSENQLIKSNIMILNEDGSESYLEKQGTYNLIVRPQETPIAEIVLNNASSKTLEKLKIDDLSGEDIETPFENIKQAFAVDPVEVDFNDGNVKIRKAIGKELYKCENYNFEEKICLGDWKKLMDLIPGQEYEFYIDKYDPAFVEVDIQTCAAESNSEMEDSFDSVCDFSDGSSLLYDDSNYEVHDFGRQGTEYYWAGVKTKSFNSSVDDCKEITDVQFCYKWWRTESKNDFGGCHISINAGNLTNWDEIETSCPGTSEPSSITCVDVTSSENWNCSHFFGSSGTRAQAKSEIRGAGTGKPYTETSYWDVFYFNVSYRGENLTGSPDSISNLKNISSGNDWIYWNWTNPQQSDFQKNIIYLEEEGMPIVNIGNTSNNYFNATGLIPSTNHTITIHTSDIDGNINNSNISNTAKTNEYTVLFQEEIKNPSGETLNSTIIVQSLLNKTLYNKTTDKHNTTLKAKRYNIEIIPLKTRIDKIEIKEHPLISNKVNDLVDVEEGSQITEHIFSINPKVNLNKINVIAKGNKLNQNESGFRILEKCVDWNFTTGTCSGEWIPVASLMEDGYYHFYMNSTDPGFKETVSSCVAEDSAAKGSFGGTCDDTTGGYLELDDLDQETHTVNKDLYGGVKIESANSSETNCGNITQVEICYKWWMPTGTPSDCDVSVDADSGVSWSAATTTCPGESEPSSITCVDVTSSENWNCSHFFGSSGTRAQAKSEITRDSAGASATYTVYWDVLYFNVSFNSSDVIPPASVTNLNNQSHGDHWIYWNWTNPTDADFDKAIVYINGTNRINTSNNYYNATELAGNSTYVITVHTRDLIGNVNNTDVNDTGRTLVDNTNPCSVENLNNQSAGVDWIYWNWTEPCGDIAEAIVYINGTNVNNVSTQYYNATGLEENTTYMITINTKDATGNLNDTDVNDTGKTTYIAQEYASYNSDFGAPYCKYAKSPCIANSSLIMSRDSLATPEPNQPNTIDTCADGTSGTYQTDESVENITLTSHNNSYFTEGDDYLIEFVVYCYSTADNINLVYTNNSNAATPSWRVLGYVDSCSGTGFVRVSGNFTLDEVSGNHSVRASIQYNGDTTSTCGTGSYDDNDDLTFYVRPSPPDVSVISPIENSNHYVSDSVEIAANVTDNRVIDFVWAEITYPNSTKENITLNLVSGTDKYNGSFNAPDLTGRYDVKFFANDTIGNLNDDETTYFNVQKIQTKVEFEIDNTEYKQGTSDNTEDEVFVNFQAKYLDATDNSEITEATCTVVNNATSDSVSLTYNTTSKNYTGELSTHYLYGNVQFNVTCEKTNYQNATNNTNANVYFAVYLWEYQNLTYGYSGNDSTTEWMRKPNPTTSNVYTLSLNKSLQNGSNFIRGFPYLGEGTNGSSSRTYYVEGPLIMSLNLSVNDTTCKPYLCVNIKSSSLDDLTEKCFNEKTISANVPTVIEGNYTANPFTINQGWYLFVNYYLNCSANTSGNTKIYYNYSTEPTALKVTYAKPSKLIANIENILQLEKNFTIGPNQTQNSTKRVWIGFNNSDSFDQSMFYWLKFGILSSEDKIISNSSYVYNFTGDLWASDNTTIGAPNTIERGVANQIGWQTEEVPANTKITEILNTSLHDILLDSETLTKNSAVEKTWRIEVWNILSSMCVSENVTVWTNYSTYGAEDDWIFIINKTTPDGTNTNITSFVVQDSNLDTLTMPEVDITNQKTNYTIIARKHVPPHITLHYPQNAEKIYSKNITFNFSVNGTVSTFNCSIYINGTLNKTNESVQKNVVTEFTINNFDYGSYNWHINCSEGTKTNVSETRNFSVEDDKAPLVFDLIPNGENFNASDTIEISANATDEVAIDSVYANITYPNSTYEILDLGLVSGTDKYNNSFVIPSLLGRYNITMVANDTTGNVNDTETTYFFAIDEISPLISSVEDSPDPVSFIEPVNITAIVTEEIGVDSVWVLINGTNYTMDYDSKDGWHYDDFNISSVYAGTYDYVVYANDTSGNNATPVSGNFTITSFVSISVFDVPINFSNVLPGGTTNATSGAGWPAYVKNDGNVKVNISMNGSDLVGLGDPTYVIGLGNVYWDFINPFNTNHVLTASPTEIITDLGMNENQSLYFKLNAPLNIKSQNYRGNVTFNAEES